MPREKPPLRCHHFGCNRFAKTPEGWDDDTRIVAMPECTPCRARDERRTRRAANLMRNLANSSA